MFTYSRIAPHPRKPPESPGEPGTQLPLPPEISHLSSWEWAEESIFLTCFPDEYYTASQSLGHLLSLESHNKRRILFSYLGTTSSFLFVSTPWLFTCFHCEMVLVYPRTVLGVEEKQRGFAFGRSEKSLGITSIIQTMAPSAQLTESELFTQHWARCVW